MRSPAVDVERWNVRRGGMLRPRADLIPSDFEAHYRRRLLRRWWGRLFRRKLGVERRRLWWRGSGACWCCARRRGALGLLALCVRVLDGPEGPRLIRCFHCEADPGHRCEGLPSGEFHPARVRVFWYLVYHPAADLDDEEVLSAALQFEIPSSGNDVPF